MLPFDSGWCSSPRTDKFKQPSEQYGSRRLSAARPGSARYCPAARGLDRVGCRLGTAGRDIVKPIVSGHDPLANRNVGIAAEKQLPGFGRVHPDLLKPVPVTLDRLSAAFGLDCGSRNGGRGGTKFAVVCHVEHPSLWEVSLSHGVIMGRRGC